MNIGATSGAASATEVLSVLCVDDEGNILNYLKRLFRAEPFQVLTAGSGAEGLEILKTTGNIGLILSDQRMPEMSGSLFLAAARAVAPDIPRIILTGYADFQSARDAINQGGASRFLVKPCNEQELLLAVRDGLCQYRLGKLRNLAELQLRQARDLVQDRSRHDDRN